MNLADRMKSYEKRTEQLLLPLTPVIARLDGRAFHTFTRGLKRPYDGRLTQLMTETTMHLVRETHARCGYTQSDEITLVWRPNGPDSESFFGGRVQKMQSILASMTSAFFCRRLPEVIPEKGNELPVFDCRVFNVPSDSEAVNCFLWRERDATKNSISMAAQSVYSHSELHGKHSSAMHDMLHQKGINWNDYPASFKRGTYVRKRTIDVIYTPDELDALPEEHLVRRIPDMTFKRTVVLAEDFPPLGTIINRESVILYGEEPALEDVEC